MRRFFLRKEEGQVLVLGLVVLMCLTVVIWTFYQLMDRYQKSFELIHATDMATYSGAMTQTNLLNGVAYANRTMLAHQVAMAHLVTAGNMNLFAKNESSRFVRMNPPVYIIKRFFGLIQGGAYAYSKIAGSFSQITPLKIAYKAHDALIQKLLIPNTRYIQRHHNEMRDQAIQHSLERSFPDWQVKQVSVLRTGQAISSKWGVLLDFLGRKKILWSVQSLDGDSFLKTYEGNTSQRELLLKLRSFYPYLEDRTQVKYSVRGAIEKCKYLPPKLSRIGSTGLSKDGTWYALDTLSYYKVLSVWIPTEPPIKLCIYREYPMAWGGVMGSRRFFAPLGLDFDENPPWDFAKKKYADWLFGKYPAIDQIKRFFSGNYLARSWAFTEKSRHQWSGTGFMDYVDLKKKQLKKRFLVRVQLYRGHRLISTASAIGVSQYQPIQGELPSLWLSRWSAGMQDEFSFVQ